MRSPKHILLLTWTLFAFALASNALQLSYPAVGNKKQEKTVPDFDTKVTNKLKERSNHSSKQPQPEGRKQKTDSIKLTRWQVQPITPICLKDLRKRALDLKWPKNLIQTVEYNDTLGLYVIGTKSGNSYTSTPIYMTRKEYLQWSQRKLMDEYFKQQNQEVRQNKGVDKFDFTDMHFELGPAEKIFGPGGVSIRTQGSAELKLGATHKNIQNPSLPIRTRKKTTMNFDEKVNVNVTGKVGDKVDMKLNYNTDATFDFDAQNLKLKYEGKEDEIIKLIEAGNVSFPSNSSLVKGAGSLFGLRTDLQFGRLKLQLVASQKKSSSKNVSSRGGVSLTPFEINVADYEENKHFFLAKYFRDIYDKAMRTLPNITTGITINRVEVWVTNKTGTTANTRNIIALTDLGESGELYNKFWHSMGNMPDNNANNLYQQLNTTYQAARNMDETHNVLGAIPNFNGGNDYEKLQNARLLQPSEYHVNTALGYISFTTDIQSDQVLGVAYEYTYGGKTYQVGEFTADNTDNNQALLVKCLKNTDNNPSQGNWDLMMKNVYYLATTVEKEKFRLDVKYQNDTSGVYVNYIPESAVKDKSLIRVIGADRLDNKNNLNPNGYFDFIEGYTVSEGRVFLPLKEPFGRHIIDYLKTHGVSENIARKYAFTELYDSTKNTAKQIAEKNKYILVGQYKGTAANIISLGAFNVPRGSVVVTAGGVTLTEGADYTVDYYAGEVTIINQSIIDAGTPVDVSLESNTEYGLQRKTMLGMNWEYTLSRDLQLSGTVQHLFEQPLTTKVNMGSEPLNNTLWGVNINWKKESQWLTDVLDKLPLLELTQPSYISFTGEYARLIAGKNKGTQDNASYIDDFENTKSTISIATPQAWVLSSVPSEFSESKDKTTLRSGFNRSLLSWYNIDPLFTRRNSSLTPSHIKSDLDQLSDYYVREVYTRELFPNKSQSNYNGTMSTIPVLNIAYYPQERGPYNFNPDLNAEGLQNHPSEKWGGMMRKIETNDFQTANIEYIEFWLMDPFIYSSKQPDANEYGGDLYINLGEISEDVLKDGKKYYESGLPIDGAQNYVTTQWGKVPAQPNTVYAFSTETGARQKQDLGLNGLNDEEEKNFAPYQSFLKQIQGKVTNEVWQKILRDPANDNYHYFRGADLDQQKTSILERYKYINNPQGNSPESDDRNQRFDISYKMTPDVEDINQDFTLNEYEKYYRYKISLRPEDLQVGKNFIVDKRETVPSLRNKKPSETVTWYQFRVPVSQYMQKVGNISDFTSIRFIRMFLTQFKKPVVLRFATFDLVRGDWRKYRQTLNPQSAQNGNINVSAVSYEENGDKTPVNYILPPGIRRSTDPTQPQLVEDDEQALCITAADLSAGQAEAVYKNTHLDMRRYKQVQMFVHANALQENLTQLKDYETSVFVRFGSDYKNNYYEYEIPLKLTPPGTYNARSLHDCKEVWPEENMLDIPIKNFVSIKARRNKAKNQGITTYNTPYSEYDKQRPQNRITIVGNPSLGEIKTIMIGVRNNTMENKSVEIWANEFRLKEYNDQGGWAAQGSLNLQLSDFGSVNVRGQYIGEGFGGIEDGVTQRAVETNTNYNITTTLQLGKLFPQKAKVMAPLYYSVTHETSRPKYNPMDNDMPINEALQSMDNKAQRDSLLSIAQMRTKHTNFSLSNVKVDIQTPNHPMPYDPANFTFSYSHSNKMTEGQTLIYEKEENWRAGINYNWAPQYKPFKPFAKIRNQSKWLEILKKFGINWLPQNIAFNTEMSRDYYELQERDMENTDGQRLPLIFNQQFLWNRSLSLRWDPTDNLHINFQCATNAEIEEPYMPVNKQLFSDKYAIWKDSVMTGIRNMGKPLDYNQNLTISYQPPTQFIPILTWVSTNATYSATYNWNRGALLEDGTSLGNIIANNRDLNLNTNLDLVKLYNYIPFLKNTNLRFDKTPARPNRIKRGKTTKQEPLKQKLPKNKNSYEKEITIRPDTCLLLTHDKNTRRVHVSFRTQDGKTIKLKYKIKGKNQLRVYNPMDSALTLKVVVTPKEKYENQSWYKTAQTLARVAMMVRNVGITYHNQSTMSLPGFMPVVGKAFGQNTQNGLMAPGIDFALGLTGEEFIRKAGQNHWLLENDSIATPATSNAVNDIQLKATLEPIKNLIIDLNASYTASKAKSIQYMTQGNPVNESGTFNMTTVSIKNAFEPIGSAHNGYGSAAFDRFCHLLEPVRNRVQDAYRGTKYPVGTALHGKPYDPAYGEVGKYASEVMIPAFLQAYTSSGRESLDLFPRITRILPNWNVRYTGLSHLPLFSRLFKNVTITHGYKSIFAIGSYNTYSTYVEFMDGRGFITDPTTSMPIPSSRYNVSTVSVNEAFSPLLGVNLTFDNDMTARLEYKTTHIISLSTTSVQIGEATSKDWVLGWGWRINEFKPFAPRKVKSRAKSRQKKQAKETMHDSDVPRSGSNFNNALNLRTDLTYRSQANIIRDIQTMTSTANSGNMAFKLSLMADYSLSRMITMSFFYDTQINKPLLSNSGYPTTVQDFGLSLKFSLTR